MERLVAGVVVIAALVACGDDSEPGDDGGGAAAGSGAAGSGATGAGAGSAGGSDAGSGGSSSGGKASICAAYAQLAIDCCTPDVPNCQPDTYDGWYQFCFDGYEACQAAYDCLATATCETAESCPNFGSGCQ